MKMDNIGATNHHYRAISRIAMGWMLALVQAYLMLIFSGIDLVDFNMISDPVVRYVVLMFVQLIVIAFVYSIVYTVVKKIYCRHWINSHKNIWVQGIWLHIHMKHDVRIGTVEIKQNFYTIQANGNNISPRDANVNLPQKSKTKWSYFLSKVADDATARDFIGCYTADEMGRQTEKDGIHVLRILPSAKGGYPIQMEGCFRDTCRVSEQGFINEIDTHVGELYLFKLSGALKNRLCDKNGFRYDLLRDLHQDEQFKDELYVQQLKECIEEWQRRYGQ